jgi:hypothetical protein
MAPGFPLLVLRGGKTSLTRTRVNHGEGRELCSVGNGPLSKSGGREQANQLPLRRHILHLGKTRLNGVDVRRFRPLSAEGGAQLALARSVPPCAMPCSIWASFVPLQSQGPCHLD